MEFLPAVTTDLGLPLSGPPAVSAGTSVAGPLISPPIYATPPSRVGGSIPFNERFKPSEGVAMESMYSLAHCVESEVHRQLSVEQEVEAGTPLSEALASKGLTGSTPRTSSISSASGGDANTSLTSDPSSFLSPHHDPVPDIQNLYSPVPKKGSGGAGVVRPVPKPRGTSTLNPRSTDQNSPVPGWGARAETLPNGYQQPRQINRAGNYDQLPPGPPRPVAPSRLADQALPSSTRVADPPRPVSRQLPTAQPQKHHRSALLRDVTAPPAPSQGDLQAGPSPTAGGPTYINVRHMAEDLPPMISRKNKPSPPRVDRKLKPRDSEGSLDLTAVFATRVCAEEDHSDGSESPPDFPMRTSSLANALEASGPLSCPLSSGRDKFCEPDLPKPSPHTMQYTQVEFDAVTGKHSIVETNGQPQPAPRRGQGSPTEPQHLPVPVPRLRVNYSDVDLVATNALKVSREQVTLREAEIKALQDKPYINVKKNGGVDEESDPGYYTHMRVSMDQAMPHVGRTCHMHVGQTCHMWGDMSHAREVGITCRVHCVCDHVYIDVIESDV